jgi:hypothetical protein
MKDVAIPTHVKFVFGDGVDSTNIISKANTNTSNGSAMGALSLMSGSQDLVIDGFNIILEDKPQNPEGVPPGDCNPNLWPYEDYGYSGPSGNSWRWFGHITIWGHVENHNLNIRNCKFDVTNFRFNCIKIFGGDSNPDLSKLNTNMIINNNYFEGFWQFAIECIAMLKNDTGTIRTITGLRMFNNDFNTVVAGGFPLSLVSIYTHDIGTEFPTDGSDNRIFNNVIRGQPVWAMEFSYCHGWQVYNNIATGVSQKIMSSTQGSEFLDHLLPTSKIYQNHFVCTHIEGVESGLNVKDKNEWYENFIDSSIITNETVYEDSLWEFGHWHHNTIIYSNDGSEGRMYVFGIRYSTKGIINDNEIYAGSLANKGIDYGSSASGAGNECYNNVINMKRSDGTCVNKIHDDIDDHDNTCNLGWTGEYPTGRDGAGLYDDTVIGPGNYPVFKGD